MEMLILLVWSLMVFCVPFLLLVTAYYKYCRQEKVSRILIRLGVTILGYGLITATTLPFFIVIIFAGPDSEIGAHLNKEEIIIYTAITAIYIGISYILILFVKGSLFTSDNNESISVFE